MDSRSKQSLYNNRIVNLFSQRRGLRGPSDKRRPGAGGWRGQPTGADRLRAGVGGAGGGGQATIALNAILACYYYSFFSVNTLL